MPSCLSCKFSFAAIAEKSPELKCRFDPPRATAIAFPTQQGIGVQIISAWPTVKDVDHCSHWSQSSNLQLG
jgi:hypothetical protein